LNEKIKSFLKKNENKIKSLFNDQKQKWSNGLFNKIRNDISVYLETNNEMTLKEILKKYICFDEKNKKFKNLLNKDIQSIFKDKRRKHDIDSNKKLLKKLLWNHIMNGLCKITDIKNIKQINDDIKHNTKKEFDRKLMDRSIKDAYFDFYKQDYEFLKKNLNFGTYEVGHLSWYVNQTLKEMLIQFRNSEKFLYLAKVSAKNDQKKLKKKIYSPFKMLLYIFKI